MKTGHQIWGHKMEISLEVKVHFLYLVKKCGINSGSATFFIKRKIIIKKLVSESCKIVDGGLPYLMWPELMSMKKNERETEADLRKRIKYLEAKVAYYEELSKLEGVDLGKSVKKNAAVPSEPSLKGESEP